jgi:hypothetical protein
LLRENRERKAGGEAAGERESEHVTRRSHDLSSLRGG